MPFFSQVYDSKRAIVNFGAFPAPKKTPWILKQFVAIWLFFEQKTGF
jgi:hypothetical protein